MVLPSSEESRGAIGISVIGGGIPRGLSTSNFAAPGRQPCLFSF